MYSNTSARGPEQVLNVSQINIFVRSIEASKNVFITVELELQSVGRTAGGVVLEHYIIQHRLRVRINYFQETFYVVCKNTMECNGWKHHIKLYREGGRRLDQLT